MIRKSFLIRAKPGMAVTYEQRHNPIWPELKAVLKDHGVHNFSIHLHQDTGYLFGYLEIEDEQRYNRMAENEVCHRWWKYMTEVLVCENADSVKGKEEMLREVFHLD